MPGLDIPATSVKEARIGWEHGTFPIADHLKPPTVAKRCTFLESWKSPALRGFVAGRWRLRPPPFILVRKSNASEGPETGRSGGVLFLDLDSPGSRRPTHGPTLSKCPPQGHHSILAPKLAHRSDTAATAVLSCLPALCLSTPGAHNAKWVRTTPANAPGCRLRQARCSACPTQWWVKRPLDLQPPDELLQARHRAKFFLLNFPIGARPLLCFIEAQLLRWVYRLDPESDPEQEKSQRSGEYMTSGIWQISGTKKAKSA